ncbi:uncharacterized protein involved in exopolysaccharide biosynthesis [Rhodoblastus acidophilus]|nr:exopolysaccharide transport family protein [Rhodoblastus acidophilus]MCW2276062.1 uncharacterized protein involved in exopolysaccharide biosynthesis [Rhodoblastus acidophilus]
MSASDPDFDARERRDEVDVAGTLSALARRKGLIAGATVGCAAAALAFCLVVKPRYIAEARVIVEDQETFYTRPDPASRGESGSQLIDAEAINSQIQLVSSRDLARKAVSALQLQKLPEFDPAPSGPLALLSLLTGGGKASEDRLLNNYFDHLQVLSPTKSRILQIEFSSRDPDLAANAANTIANLYIDLKQQAKRESAREAAQSLKPQIAELQQRVIEAEAKVADFRLANDLYDSAENRSLPTQQLADLATKLADARATQSEAMAKAKALRVLLSRNRLGDAGEISNNDLVRTIAARRSAVEAQLAAESRTLLSGHPKIKELQAQLYDLDMQLRTAVDKAARGLEHEAGVQETRVAELSRQLDEQKRNVGVANGVETRLRELQRQAKTLKDQLESESAKYQAAVGRERSENTPADARIVSRAVAPSTPAFPKKGPITLFGALAGLFFSSFYVIARETLGGGAPAPAPVAGGEQGRARRPLGARWSDALAGAAARLTGARAQAKDGPIDDHRPVQDRPVEVEPVEITAVQFKAVEDKPVEVTPVQVKPVEDEPAENKPVPTNRLRAAWLGAFSKLKTVLAEFGAPAVKLDDPETLDIPQEKLEPATKAVSKTAARAGVDGVWTRDPFALRTEAKPDFGVRRETLAPAATATEDARPAREPKIARELIERIVAAGDGAQGVIALLADSGVGASPLYALIAARALSREGRAILAQLGPDGRLDAAMAEGCDPAQPGLVQLLAGEASYAEAIYRDGETRLHLLGRGGGALDVEVEDLRMVIEVLRATYDFVLLAVASDALGLDLAREADAVVALGPPSIRRDYLLDDFAAAGARNLILASPAFDGQLTEGAA